MDKDSGSKSKNSSNKTAPNRLSEKIRRRLEDLKFGQTARTAAQVAAQVAAQTAKQGLDQVLLGLQHRGVVNVKDTSEIQDILQRAGRSVLSRAEEIRSEIAKNPRSPAWLKNVSFSAESPAHPADEIAEKALESENEKVTSDASGSMTESSVSVAAVEMQPEPMAEFLAHGKKAKIKKKKSSKAKGKTN